MVPGEGTVAMRGGTRAARVGGNGASDSLKEAREHIATARRSARQLTLFLAEGGDPLLDAMLRLLDLLEAHPGDPGAASAAYRRLFRLLAGEAEFHEGALVGSAWRHALAGRILADDNPFARKAALGPAGALSPALRAAAASDLRSLQALYRLDSGHLLPILGGQAGLVPWESLEPLRAAGTEESAETLSLMQAMAQATDWGALVDDLARHFAQAGSGLFHRYRALRWVSDGAAGRLEGVAHPDPIVLDDLIGCGAERALLVRNTEHFLAGSPANNVLLYGDRGTGKSSSIKALLNAYAGRGLRLIEVHKQDLDDLPRILEILRGRRERFILFVDDLSFEENETHYKQLKAVLEGGLEARPANVVLYATSNRRHLIIERFSDRDGNTDEVHARDTAQEKLSLSDRFGIRITFLAPSQEEYLEIVEGLARRRGLAVPEGELRRQALQWAARHNGWSGRTARQFIDFALGEQGRSE